MGRVVYELLLDSIANKIAIWIKELNLSPEDKHLIFLKYKVYYFDQNNGKQIDFMLENVMPSYYPSAIVNLLKEVLSPRELNADKLKQSI